MKIKFDIIPYFIDVFYKKTIEPNTTILIRYA